MSRRHQLELRRQKLGEAREIMNSMKSLAFMESRKLSRFLDIQREVVATLNQAAGDFLKFHPECRVSEVPGAPIYLLLGSERGFCGAFNETLVEALSTNIDTADVGLIACGHKLASQLEQDSRLVAHIDGASVLDEVDQLLNRLVEVLTELQQSRGPLMLRVYYHDPDLQQVVSQQLLPPFVDLDIATPPTGAQPWLTLPPSRLFTELVDHFLFATLHELVYLSLMAENHQRMQHLDGAVRYLDETLETMHRKSNQLRQEEITEEIEVILLNAGSSETHPLPSTNKPG